MNLPNKLTMMRVVLIPVYLVLWHLEFPGNNYAALTVFIVASLTDFLDGYIARKHNLVTDFGKFMDPLADKMLVMAALIVFVELGRLPAWAVLIVVVREFAVTALRLIAVEGGRVIAAGWSGKIKTASTMVCLALMHLWGEPSVMGTLDWVCVAVIAATTLYSGVEYFVKNQDVLNWNK